VHFCMILQNAKLLTRLSPRAAGLIETIISGIAVAWRRRGRNNSPHRVGPVRFDHRRARP